MGAGVEGEEALSENTIQSAYLVKHFHNSLLKSQHRKLLITHYGTPVAYLVSLKDMIDLENKLMARREAGEKSGPGITNVIGDCEDCGEAFKYCDNVKESAAYHAKSFKHQVHVEVITWFKYDGRDRAAAGTLVTLKEKP